MNYNDCYKAGGFMPDVAKSGATSLTITAKDGYVLSATRFDTVLAVRGNLIVAGATGVPQGFYRRFAEYACSKGFNVMTFDYRGIGKSRPASLKGFQMDYLDWARLDLAAVVDTFADDDLPLYMIGHSFGGHAFGLLPNHHRITRFYTFALGAGWHGWMPLLERMKVQFMWYTVLPLLTRWKGYSPWRMLGLGEDLPQGVFWRWRHWCKFPNYFFGDPEMKGIADEFARVRTPIAAANALDDLWALPRSRNAFIGAYRNAPVELIDLDPRDAAGSIGHMGYFRSSSQPLWDAALNWLQA